MNKSKHILIAGTGRTGTSFLMQLLTELNLDTGFKKGVQLEKGCNAGLESHISNIDRWSYIVKNPRFSLVLNKINAEVDIEHLIIPVRDNRKVALSRENNGTKNGGFWMAEDYDNQIVANAFLMQTITQDIAAFDIPHTYLWFDDMITNPDYLYDKLYPIFDLDYYDFIECYNKIIDIKKVNF